MRYNKGQYRKMVKKNNINNAENQARYLANEGRFDEATSILKDELGKDSSNEHLRYELGMVYFKQRHYQEAIDELKLIEEPTTIKPFFVYQKLGTCYSFLSMYEEAYYYLLKAYYDDPKKDEKNMRFLIIAGRKGGLNEELAAFLDSNPFFCEHDTVFQIIFFYHNIHKNYKALKYIKEYKFTPKTIYETRLVADVYADTDNLKTAVYYVDKYNHFDEKDASFFVSKGIIKFLDHDYDEAYELLKKVNESNCAQSLIYKSASWLARIELLKGNIDMAKKYFSDLDDSPVKDILNAEIEASQGNYDVAKNILETMILPTNNSIEVLILYVNILTRLKEYSKAKDVTENYLLKYPNVPEKTLIEINRYYTIAKKNLGESIEYSGSYFINQISGYSNIRSLNHIMAHYYSENGSGKFSPSFNINNEYFKIRNIIKDMTPIFRSLSETVDKYIIDYPNAGVLGNIHLDKIQVVTIMETKDIITFYPVSKYTFGYEFEEDFAPKKEPQKRLTQIEKFNQRYGNKNNN